MDRMTIKNPNGSYRIPMSRGGSIRHEWQQEQTVLYGGPVDRLGAYEDIGTPQEFALLKKNYGTIK